MRPAANGIAALFGLFLHAAAPGAADGPPRAAGVAGAAAVLDQKGEHSTLKTPADKTFAVYVVGPQDAPRGILIIPVDARLDAQARAWAHRFAALGYRAMAVEAGAEHAARDPALRGARRPGPDQNEANAKYRAAFEALRHPARKLAAFGACAGGAQALEASLAAPDLVSATVVYFGVPATDPKRLAYLESPVLVLAGKGAGDAPGRLASFEAAMRQAGRVLEVERHGGEGPCGGPGAGPSTEPPQWQATVDFLNRHLR